jgi:NADPH:quinone reductase-like Zn-dependent oxidoreductase
MTAPERAEAARNFERDILGRYAERRMAPLIDRVFGFDELPAAKDHMESNAMVGKIVVKIG